MAVTSFIRKAFSGKSEQKETKNSSERSNTTRCCKAIDCSKLSSQQSAQAFYRFIFTNSQNDALTVPQKLVMNVVRDTLCKKEPRLKAVPRLPMIIPKLFKSLRDPKSSAKDYVEIVNKDPVMSAAVLKLANSVYFNPTGSRIEDIERAIVKLGIDGLRSVLSAAVMQPIIQKDSPYYSQTGLKLWTHSLNTAVACEVIGHSRQMERFKVYLLGLVHDIGKITLFSELCQQYKLNGDASPGKNAFIPPMSKLSTQLSYLIAKDWQLPDEICLALREQINIAPGKLISPYGQLLYQANIACEAYAFTPRNKHKALSVITNELKLPDNLFNRLNEVSTQV